MPITYTCDMCGVTAVSLTGWVIASVAFLHLDPAVPQPPGGRMTDTILPDLLFHAADCRDAWLTKAGLSVPATAPAAVR